MCPVHYKPALSTWLQLTAQFIRSVVQPTVIISLPPHMFPFIRQPFIEHVQVLCMCVHPCGRIRRALCGKCNSFLLTCVCVWAGETMEISTDTSRQRPELLRLCDDRPILATPVQNIRLEMYRATALHRAQINHQTCAAGNSACSKGNNAEEMLSLIKWQGSTALNGGNAAALQYINKVRAAVELSGACVNV